MTLTWKKDGELWEATHSDLWLYVEKTHSVPPRKIPSAQKWTLGIHGPWYACVCKPTRRACFEAAERYLEALDVLEPSP